MDTEDGTLAVALAPSAVPTERFHVMPRAMPVPLIREIVDGFGASAARLERAGLDGCEIVASHGYLPSQFLNPRTNLRTDAYGGDPERRLRFLREALAAARAATRPGLRGGAADLDRRGDAGGPHRGRGDRGAGRARRGPGDGLRERGRRHVRDARRLGPHRAPVAVGQRLHGAPGGPREGRRLASRCSSPGGSASPRRPRRSSRPGRPTPCVMTRALICDPELPAKTEAGRLDDIRACIGCNQACIGHFHAGYPISCIQFPESGREREFPRIGRPGEERHPAAARVARGPGDRGRAGRAQGGRRRRRAGPPGDARGGRAARGRPGAAGAGAAGAGGDRRRGDEPAVARRSGRASRSSPASGRTPRGSGSARPTR